jgi:hypothetical protein
MAHFFLQDISESDALDIEIAELKSELNQSRSHTYQVVTSSYFANYNDAVHSRDWIKKYGVPVGSIEFVQTFLREFHCIQQMNPIEIPKCLRLPHILLRDYKIVAYENLPREGKWFIKDVSRLKSWTYQGDVSNLFQSNSFPEQIDSTNLFQVSKLLPIISEYRVIVIENKIFGIQFYNGDPTIMPTPKEIKRIKEMVVRWSAINDCPGAYTLDVAVVRTENEDGRDLALIEAHASVSTGNYGCRGAFLPRMYELGFKWYVEHNTPIEENTDALS